MEFILRPLGESLPPRCLKSGYNITPWLHLIHPYLRVHEFILKALSRQRILNPHSTCTQHPNSCTTTAADINVLSPLIVAYSSVRKLLKDTRTPLQEAPSSRAKTLAPSTERQLLTFIAAVCCLHSDCNEAAVAVSRGSLPSVDTTIFYVATLFDVSTALQSDFHRFVDDFWDAYNNPGGGVVGTCEDQVLAAMYRFAYPALRECLWNDDRFQQQASSYLGRKVARLPVLQALEKLKAMTKESDPTAVGRDIFHDMHESCRIIRTFERDEVRPGTYFLPLIQTPHLPKGVGTVVSDFLSDIACICNIASYSGLIISGACLANKHVASLMGDTYGDSWEIVWILPPPPLPPAMFEAELSTSDVAAFLEEYSRCSSILPWAYTVTEIASTCPALLTKTGSRYTCDEPPPFHCEIVPLLWLFDNDIAVDKHIGYSSVVCYLCSKLAQALGKVYPEYDFALSDVFDSTAIELPWVLPPDVPDAVIKPLRDIITEDFCRGALTYITRDGLYEDALGLGVPEFPKVR